MKNLTAILDRVANELETRGLKKLAFEVDVVANTLEHGSSRVAFSYNRSTLGGLFHKFNLPVPNEAEPYLDVTLWDHVYNKNWSTPTGDKPYIQFDNVNYRDNPLLWIEKEQLTLRDGKWVPHH